MLLLVLVLGLPPASAVQAQSRHGEFTVIGGGLNNSVYAADTGGTPKQDAAAVAALVALTGWSLGRGNFAQASIAPLPRLASGRFTKSAVLAESLQVAPQLIRRHPVSIVALGMEVAMVNKNRGPAFPVKRVIVSTAMQNERRNSGMHRQRNNEEILLFIGVNTAPGNYARRVDVRSSWMQHPLLQAASGQAQAKFIVGRPVCEDGGGSTSKVAGMLASEQQLHHDFVQMPVEDTYNGLTHKTLVFLRWFASSDGPQARFLMKLDDDTYPHLTPLVALLREECGGSGSSDAYLGYFHRCAIVKREGKNAETIEEWSASVFPTYASGSGYLLSSPLVAKLASQKDLVSLHNEDVSVGVLVDEVSADSKVDFKPISATLYGCAASDVLSMNLGHGAMTCMWERWLKGYADVCCDSGSRIYAKPIPDAAVDIQTLIDFGCAGGAPELLQVDDHSLRNAEEHQMQLAITRSVTTDIVHVLQRASEKCHLDDLPAALVAVRCDVASILKVSGVNISAQTLLSFSRVLEAAVRVRGGVL